MQPVTAALACLPTLAEPAPGTGPATGARVTPAAGAALPAVPPSLGTRPCHQQGLPRGYGQIPRPDPHLAAGTEEGEGARRPTAAKWGAPGRRCLESASCFSPGSSSPQLRHSPSPGAGADAGEAPSSRPSPPALLLVLQGGLRPAAPGHRGGSGRRRHPQPCSRPRAAAPCPPPQPPLAVPAPAAALSLGQLPRSREQPDPVCLATTFVGSQELPF